jgi:GT2 family glycosyltransferase
LSQRVGIVVPTLGKRPDYLEQSLRSIRAAGDAYILLVAPASFQTSGLESASLIDSVVSDAGGGPASAINQGIQALPESVEYTNWLGDDDLLIAGSLKNSAQVLDSDPNVVMAFGACEYIDSNGKSVWENRSGQWAVALLRFGPDLVPQPGALFRRSVFETIGGLKLMYLNQTLAQFRWHPESLSVEHRKKSVAEASKVRVSHLPALLRPISFLWEYPVRQATLIAGKRVTARAQAKARNI